MDLLLDVNVVLDLCGPRMDWYPQASRALACCDRAGGRAWLYAGAVQTMEYGLRQVLLDQADAEGEILSSGAAGRMAREILREFSAGKHWLAALAGEGDVFGHPDPEGEQFLRALQRFPPGACALLTRDGPLLERRDPRILSPEQYCRVAAAGGTLDFVDLRAQQDAVRARLEAGLHRVLHHGNYILGPEVGELEETLAAYVGARHAIGCASGTDALLLPLMALGVGPGDAVFTTPFTFIATAEVISLLGATPVFVDIDPATYNLDPGHLDKAVRALKAGTPSLHPLPSRVPGHPSPVPKAVIGVDLYGLPADYDAIQAVCTEHGLALIEDAAQSFGAEYKGRKTCSFGDAAATSFFPAKPLGCYGDGGMVFTNRDELAETMRSLRVHGKGTDKYDNVRIGLNARLDTLQAALVLAKFEVFPEEVEARQRVSGTYTAQFEAASSRCVAVPRVPDGLRSAWAQYTIRVEASRRGRLQAALGTTGIPTAVYYPKPLHLQTAFRQLGYRPGGFPASEAASAEVLSLPFGPYLKDEECARIAAEVLACEA